MAAALAPGSVLSAHAGAQAFPATGETFDALTLDAGEVVTVIEAPTDKGILKVQRLAPHAGQQVFAYADQFDAMPGIKAPPAAGLVGIPSAGAIGGFFVLLGIGAVILLATTMQKPARRAR